MCNMQKTKRGFPCSVSPTLPPKKTFNFFLTLTSYIPLPLPPHPYIPQKYLKIDHCIWDWTPLPPRFAGKSNAGLKRALHPHQFFYIFDAFLTGTGAPTPGKYLKYIKKLKEFFRGRVGETEQGKPRLVFCLPRIFTKTCPLLFPPYPVSAKSIRLWTVSVHVYLTSLLTNSSPLLYTQSSTSTS